MWCGSVRAFWHAGRGRTDLKICDPCSMGLGFTDICSPRLWWPDLAAPVPCLSLSVWHLPFIGSFIALHQFTKLRCLYCLASGIKLKLQH